MPRGRKTTIVLGILSLGILGAMPFFRPARTVPAVARLPATDELSLRGVPLQVSTQSNASPAVGLYDEDPAPVQGAPAADLAVPRFSAGLEHLGPPPEFTSTYPTLLESVDTWTSRQHAADVVSRSRVIVRPASAESRLPGSEPLRRHRVVDGDTLARLAGRYLGDSSRAGEIYQANREALATPEVLPLGIEIVIPPTR